MPVTPLSIPQINLLLALRALKSTVTTVDLGDAFGMGKIEPSVRKRLSDLGFINAWKEGRSFRYELTDAGAGQTRELLKGDSPRGLTPRTARILWAICNDFSSAGGAHEIQSSPPPESLDVDARIRQAYDKLATGTADWVPLRELRTVLADLERGVVDGALSAMLARQAALLIPEENQKTLTAADREAAIYFGGQARHLIAIERP